MYNGGGFINTTQEEQKLITGTYDFMFKAIMLDEKNREYLKQIIHYVTEIPLSKLGDIVPINTEYTVHNQKDKVMRSDIIVKVGLNLINLEMNRSFYEGLLPRNNNYFDKLASQIYDVGDIYEEKILIQINFDNFEYFDKDKPIYKFLYKEEDLNLVLDASRIIYHVDLAFIKKLWYNDEKLHSSEFYRSVMMLTAETDKMAKEIAGDDEILKKVAQKLIDLSQDEKMIGLYNAESEREALMKAEILRAKKKSMEQGLEQGLEQGMKQGIEQGLEQGIKQGMVQKQKEIALNMKKKGIDIKTISEVTELSIIEIEKMS